jgi:hypothetical protein
MPANPSQGCVRHGCCLLKHCDSRLYELVNSPTGEDLAVLAKKILAKQVANAPYGEAARQFVFVF